jgi:shikimate kinase
MKLHGRSIVLIGMMGAGKSAVGCSLQQRTRLALLDTDKIVASKFGMSIPEIFTQYGENKFREAETEALRAVARPKQGVIVTGGGIVLRRENVDILRALGVVVWLDGGEATLFKRASQSRNRPLLHGVDRKEKFARILQARRRLYAKIADIHIDTSVFTAEEVAVAILIKLGIASRKPGSSAFAKVTADKPLPTTT